MQKISFAVLWMCTSNALFAADAYTYLPVQAGSPQGGIIVHYPDSIEPLANQIGNRLSEFGWSILLVPVVDSLHPPSTRIRANHLVRYMANEKGQRNLVLLTIGDTWDVTTNLAAPNQTEDDEFEELIQGVVLVDVPDQIQAPPTLPVLDIITRRSTESHWRKRKREAKQAQSNQQSLSLGYSTRTLREESRLEKRIRGWLDKNVKGQELADAAEP